ncbi:hypothetical protein [Kitasatospora sp. NPDC001095]
MLATHAAVQRTLPTRWARSPRPTVAEASTPEPSDAPDDDAVYAALRLRVLRTALRSHPAARLLTPWVRGLRLFTPNGGEEDAEVDHPLAAVSAPDRAAFALRTVEGLSPERAAEVLRQPERRTRRWRWPWPWPWPDRSPPVRTRCRRPSTGAPSGYSPPTCCAVAVR